MQENSNLNSNLRFTEMRDQDDGVMGFVQSSLTKQERESRQKKLAYMLESDEDEHVIGSNTDLTLDMLRKHDPQGLDDDSVLVEEKKHAPKVHRLQEDLETFRNQTMLPEERKSAQDLNELAQFRQNNAQLQQILMQLQTTPQFNETPNTYQTEVSEQKRQRAANSRHRLKQMSNPSQEKSDALTDIGMGFRNQNLDQSRPSNHRHQISHFEAAEQSTDLLGLHENSQSSLKQTSDFADQLDKIEMLQRAIANQQTDFHINKLQPNQMSNYDQFEMAGVQTRQQQPLQHANARDNSQNYRQVFKPQLNPQLQYGDERVDFSGLGGGKTIQASQNSQYPGPRQQHGQAFQNAALNILEHKENHSHDLMNNRAAEEFTLAPKQPGQSYQHGYQYTAETEKIPAKKPQVQPELTKEYEKKHNQIMKNFDDIPISQIKKMPGYQTGIEMIVDKGASQGYNLDQSHGQRDSVMKHTHPTFDANEDLETEENFNLPIAERILHPKWRVRIEAFKEINNMFYRDYAKYEETGQKSFLQGSFDHYGPLLQEMIKDSNLTGAHEALVCLQTYVKYAADIKSVTFATHNFLLEKVQHIKPNFKEITLQILLTMLKRDQAPVIGHELIKRFRSKNVKTASFSLYVVNEAFNANAGVEEFSMIQIFRSLQPILSHQNKELRDFAYSLLKHVYIRSGDDLNTFLKNCKNLRPVQTKEFTEELKNTKRDPKFDKERLFDHVEEHFVPEPVVKQESEVPETEDLVPTKESTQSSQQEIVDLFSLLPENFSEIPYSASINLKKKSLETFKQELEKLALKRAQVKIKDYSSIFNVLTHMLEDKTMLVYLEAIKTVEMLAILLGTHLKAKVKTFVILLTSKYAEMKTSVISTVDKAMAALVANSCTPNTYADLCINQISTTHKNPRVKQFVIEHSVEQFVKAIAEDTQTVYGVFKTVREKLIQLVLKENNAQVRDAAVNLLVQFACIIRLAKASAVWESEILDSINALPKPRILEINRRVADLTGEDNLAAEKDKFELKKAQTMKPQKAVVMAQQSEEEEEDLPEEKVVQEKPRFAKSFIEKVQTQKEAEKKVETVIDSSMFQGRYLAPAYKPYAAKVLNDLRDFSKNKFCDDVSQLESSWDEVLKRLGDAGLHEAKPIFMSAIYQLVSDGKARFAEHPSHLKAVLCFMKRMFVLQRSIERSDDGTSQELRHLIEIALLQNNFLKGNQAETSQLLSIGLFANNDVFEFTDELRFALEDQSILESPNSVTVLDAVYHWLGSKLFEFQAKGMKLPEIEELRSFGLKHLQHFEKDPVHDSKRAALISFMIRFKDQVAQIKSNHEEPVQEFHSKQHTEQVPKTQKNSLLKEGPKHIEEQSEEQTDEEEEITAQRIVQVLDTEFEKGLLMFKELAQSNPQIDLPTKEFIFDKLLSIVSEGFKATKDQQFKQAYALKALMWMKEETMGIEDCFKLTTKVMRVFTTAKLNEQDCSVELYLLNFWTKELSIRDILDRIQGTVLSIHPKNDDKRKQFRDEKQSLDPEQLLAFNELFKWFIETKLKNEEWGIQDFRKVVFMIAHSVIAQKTRRFDPALSEDSVNTIATHFLFMCVQKMGCLKVREFMEVQLMHSDEIYLKFLDWFEDKFNYNNQKTDIQKKEQIPSKTEGADEEKEEEDAEEVDEPVSVARRESESQNSARGQTGLSSQQLSSTQQLSYNERRQMIKASNQKSQSKELQTYDQIMSRLNQKITTLEVTQDKAEETTPASPIVSDRKTVTDPLRNTNTSAFQTDKKSRYEVVANSSSSDEADEDFELRRSKLEEKVHASAVKSQHWQQKIQELEHEKTRIESETRKVKAAKDTESEVWQQRIGSMQSEYETVVANLQKVNASFNKQVSENDSLKQQLSVMQEQHREMMSRFEEVERRITESAASKRTVTEVGSTEIRSPPSLKNTKEVALSAKKDLVVTAQNLQRIEETFSGKLANPFDFQVGVQKIQELLLSIEKNVDGDLAKPLIVHYSKMRSTAERLKMIEAIREAFATNEDVLYALSVDVYKALLNFLLKAFAVEKEFLETDQLSVQSQNEANEVTTESQKIVSKLLNSKEFTTSLVCLFQLLREAMPEDLDAHLTIGERHYLRVLMRCIQRITKALQTEQPDLIRAFDVLLEMQKLFVKHPPENLREDLPCLADFDFIYRGMKDVSDKLIELQPEKVDSFLAYSESQPANAFLKYISQMMQQTR